MEKEEYKLMFEAEQGHWWYKGLHDLLISTVRGISDKKQNISILDAGCGTGFTLRQLSDYSQSFGIDISETALSYCRKRGLEKLTCASISSIPFLDNSFDLIISADVICHKAVKDDTVALDEICRVLKPGGVMLMNLPAHDNLKRDHDESAHVRERYSMNGAIRKIKKSKFNILKITYRSAILFPVIFLMAIKNRKRQRKAESGLKKQSEPLNFILYNILRLENRLLRKFNMPFGSSIFCIAQKPKK